MHRRQNVHVILLIIVVLSWSKPFTISFKEVLKNYLVHGICASQPFRALLLSSRQSNTIIAQPRTKENINLAS